MRKLNVILIRDMETVGHMPINIEVRAEYRKSCLFFGPYLSYPLSRIVEKLARGQDKGMLFCLDPIPGGFPRDYVPDVPEPVDPKTFEEIRAYVLPDELLDVICWELFNKPPRDNEKTL